MSDIVVAKLSAWLGFNFNDKDLLKFKLGIAAASAALIKFTADTMKTTQALTNLNVKTGVSEEFANEMGRLADIAGIGKEAIFSAFESISQAQAYFKRGEGNISPYTFLGINPMDKKPEEVFKEVLKALDKFGDDAQAKTKALQDLGLDPLLQSLDLKESPLSKDLLLNKDDIKSLKDLRAEISKFQTNLAILGDKFIALATPIRTFFELGNRIINGLVLLTKNTIGFEKAAKWLSGTLLILVSLIVPKLSLVGLFLLAVEDFIVYLNGGKSVIGYFVESLKEVVNWITEWYKTQPALNQFLFKWGSYLAGGLGIAALIPKISALLSGLKLIVGAFKILQLNNPFIIILASILLTIKAIKWIQEWLDKQNEKHAEYLNSDEYDQKEGLKYLKNSKTYQSATDEEKRDMEQRFFENQKKSRGDRFQPELAQNTQQTNGGNKTITQSNNNIINVNSVKEANDMMNELKTQELDNTVMELNI